MLRIFQETQIRDNRFPKGNGRSLLIFLGMAFLAASVGYPEEHWAYQPLVKPPAGTSVDDFLDSAFEENEVVPNPEADRFTLLRRLSLNLTGLPPTLAEIEAYQLDQSPDAYEKQVDRLLASPHYGERWGRHWLDVARYVPGKIKVPGIDRIDLAEEYRDYVVRAFNEDKPYDQFITEQLAGDLLTGETDTFIDRKIGPAFLSIGPWFDECTDPNKLKLDIVDEQISTLTKAFLALDFACSRCHDHKSDPIPTKDYYALAGIFRSTQIISDFSEFWKDGRPRMTQPFALPESIDQLEKTEAKIVELEKQRWYDLSKLRRDFLEKYSDQFEVNSSNIVQEKQLKAFEAEDFTGQKNLVTVEGKYTPAIETRVPLDQWVQYDFNLNESGSFLLYIRYAQNQSATIKLELNRKLWDKPINFSNTGGTQYQHYRWEAMGTYPFKKGTNRIRLMVDKNQPFPKLDALKILRSTPIPEHDSALEKIQKRYAHSKTFWPPSIAEMDLILNDGALQEVRKTESEIEHLQAELRATKETLSIQDRPQKINEPIRSGGNVYGIKGDPIPRSIPKQLLPTLSERYPVEANQSGRLALSSWLTDRENPLTARVMVNRIWHWHFGEGIVATTDNFGALGATPKNPELLDWLASELIESNWSVKHIQSLITKSSAYRRTRQIKKEHQGQFLAAFPKKRLESEALYDSMLGTLDTVKRQPINSPLNITQSQDRALYVLTSSRSPVGLGKEIRKMFNLFGYDPSGRPIHHRSNSTTPEQSLWFLNNPLPKHYAKSLTQKILPTTTPANRWETLFLTVLSHPPNPQEKQAVDTYYYHLRKTGLTEEAATAEIILGLFSSDSFLYLP